MLLLLLGNRRGERGRFGSRGPLAENRCRDAVNSAIVPAKLCVGDTVMFNRRIRPRYLERELALITELDDRWVTVRPWRPVGRFRDGELRCPPPALRELDRANGGHTPSA